MDSARWERIQTLFHQAAERPADERAAFLGNACLDDDSLAAEVLAMLDEDAREASLLDHEVAEIAGRWGGGEEVPAALRQIGAYRVLNMLGEGGMGVVYLAQREDLGSLAAIKILRDAWMSPARRARFESERRTLAQLNHPSIARLYDADTLRDGTPFFVMEYVEGVPLTEYCRGQRCGVREKLRLFRAVCEAVHYAHRHAIIHRDLKPSNILVKVDGSVRLLDFGIAKQMDPAGGPMNVEHTRTGLRMLTPAYAAPEQIRGQSVGIHTDVYSLGVILYELLAGRLPFDPAHLTPGEMETLIVEGEAQKPSAGADLDVLCLTAMHRDAERRYGSVEALIRDVDHYLEGEPLDARPDTVGYRLGKFVGRNRRVVMAAAAVLVLVAALVVVFTVRLASARNAALAQTARTQRIQKFMLNLFDGGDKAAGPAQDLRVVTLIDHGVQEARSLNAEPAVQADLYETLGGLYQKLGKFEQADVLLRSALDRRTALFGANAPGVAESTVELGLLRVDQAKLEEAERLVRDGLDKAKGLRPPDDAAVAKATVALGEVLEARGAYAQAITVLDDAVKLQSVQGGATPELAASIVELANNHYYAGHYDVADSLNQRALAMHRQLNGERHPLVAEDLINLGAAQYDRGNYSEAERFDRQALDITESFYGRDHPETAAKLTLLARALIKQDREDQAEPLLKRALAIRERVYGALHPQVASTVNELGTMALKRGKLDEADADFRRMIEIYKSVYHDQHYLIGIAVSNLASVEMERKQFARAEQLYREAVRRFTETQSAEHLNTGIARIKLGRALLRQARYQEAEGEALAGYRILSKQASPSVSWLKNARKDLTAIYEALHQPEKVKQFQAEIAAQPALAAAR